MTATDITSDVGDCGGDVAAYALGALAPAEADAFRAHVQSCIVCRDELEAFQRCRCATDDRGAAPGPTGYAAASSTLSNTSRAPSRGAGAG